MKDEMMPKSTIADMEDALYDGENDKNQFKKGQAFFKKMYGSTNFRGSSPDKTKTFAPYLQGRSVLRNSQERAGLNTSQNNRQKSSPE